MIRNNRLLSQRTPDTHGIRIRISDLKAASGTLTENLAHCEKLLLDAGVKPAAVESLYERAGGSTISRLKALRTELHTRGVLTAPWITAVAAADSQAAAPAELVQAVGDLEKMVNTVFAAVPGTALPGRFAARLAETAGTSAPGPAATVPATPDAVRAEIKTLQYSLKAADVHRKAELIATLRKMEAGTFDQGKPGRISSARAELAGLSGKLDSSSAMRKVVLTRELRTLQAA